MIAKTSAILIVYKISSNDDKRNSRKIWEHPNDHDLQYRANDKLARYEVLIYWPNVIREFSYGQWQVVFSLKPFSDSFFTNRLCIKLMSSNRHASIERHALLPVKQAFGTVEKWSVTSNSACLEQATSVGAGMTSTKAGGHHVKNLLSSLLRHTLNFILRPRVQ